MNMLTKWINMLRGKPVATEQNDTAKEVKSDKNKEQSSGFDPENKQSNNNEDFYVPGEKSSEDSVVSDIKQAESFAKKVIDKVKSTPIPLPEVPKKTGVSKSEKVQISNQDTGLESQSKLSNALLGKLMRIFIIIVLILILVFVLFSIFQLVNKNGKSGGGNVNTTTEISPSVTPVTYRPYEPSVYAEDSVILQIEEDVSVLDAELFRTNIGNPFIKPPKLDFTIRF